jgi:hypothetical protein
MAGKQTYLKRKVSLLKREIAQINSAFYELESNDLEQQASMLERQRDDVIRGAVLQLHTSIENLIDKMIMCHVPPIDCRHRQLVSAPSHLLNIRLTLPNILHVSKRASSCR